MVPQFGYGAGDFIAGGTLIYQLIKALSGTQCLSEEYQDALAELGAFQQVFVQVSQMTSNANISPATMNSASHIVLSSMTLIGDYVAKTKSYQSRLTSWQKMGYVLFRSDELKALKSDLHQKISSISLLLCTAQYCERTPHPVPASAPREIEWNPIPARMQLESKNPSSKLTEIQVGDMVLQGSGLPSSHARQMVEKHFSEAKIDVPQILSNDIPRHLSSNSSRLVDLTPGARLNEEFCLKNLTRYEAYTIRKIPPEELYMKSTWAKAEVHKEVLSQKDITKAIEKLDKVGRRSVQDKKAALMPFQQGQVNSLVDNLSRKNSDVNFEWILVQLDRKEKTSGRGQRETTVITVYVKRIPVEHVDPRRLYEAIEESKDRRLDLVKQHRRNLGQLK